VPSDNYMVFKLGLNPHNSQSVIKVWWKPSNSQRCGERISSDVVLQSQCIGEVVKSSQQLQCIVSVVAASHNSKGI